MPLPECRTKMIATLGPSCAEVDTLVAMIRAGMDIARLNFSHGAFEDHARHIARVREAAAAAGRRVTVLADLAGPKIRLGAVDPEVVVLREGERFTLTTRPVTGGADRASVNLPELPAAVAPGDDVFINDGLVRLVVEEIDGADVHCRVRDGGEIRSRKGVNLPNARLGISAFTDEDRAALAFAGSHGVEAVSQSFVERADDIRAVRTAAREAGYDPFIIAKIERRSAVERIDEIIDAADGIMVARGDLGVELPIERIALVQKDVIRRANMAGRPVIAATQLLESMTEDELPTRAEATDVANAVLDGADCLMLSGESAIGKHPARCVSMLVQIAREIERLRPGGAIRDALAKPTRTAVPILSDLAAASVGAMVNHFEPAAIVVSSRSGGTARSIARLRPIPWIIAVAESSQACAGLSFSSGVFPITGAPTGDDWTAFVRERIRGDLVDGDLFMLASGPSDTHPETGIRVEVIDLGRGS